MSDLQAAGTINSDRVSLKSPILVHVRVGSLLIPARWAANLRYELLPKETEALEAELTFSPSIHQRVILDPIVISLQS